MPSYFCARLLLAGTSNSTTYNERMHSPAARIFSKFRASLVPNNVEALTLALFYVRKWVKDKMKVDPGVLELEEALELFDGDAALALEDMEE